MDQLLELLLRAVELLLELLLALLLLLLLYVPCHVIRYRGGRFAPPCMYMIKYIQQQQKQQLQQQL